MTNTLMNPDVLRHPGSQNEMIDCFHDAMESDGFECGHYEITKFKELI